MADDNIFWQCIQYIEGLAEDALADEPVVVSIGGSTVQKPSEFLVRELVTNVSFSDQVTSTLGASKAKGCYRAEFSVACQAWTKKSRLVEASELVQSWMLKLFKAVAADKTLGGLCIHAEPYVESGGTAFENSKLYIAAFDFGIRIKADIDPATL